MACVSSSSCWLPASLTFRHLHSQPWHQTCFLCAPQGHGVTAFMLHSVAEQGKWMTVSWQGESWQSSERLSRRQGVGLQTAGARLKMYS